MACGKQRGFLVIFQIVISIMTFATNCVTRTSSYTLAARQRTRVHAAAAAAMGNNPIAASKRFGWNVRNMNVCQRYQSRSVCQMTIADTPLGTTKKGAELLDGLDVYSVPATGDDHPLSVFGIHSSEPKKDDDVLLLLPGRTWSSVPVYHLLGGPLQKENGHESRSLMEALHNSNLQIYAMDFRGFGGTPKDSTGGVEPNRCVEDVESVLQWIARRHGFEKDQYPALFGWSQGALVAQLTAQRSKPLMSKLILYGSIYDPMIRYPREPLYIRKENVTDIENTFDSAIEDFTIEGTIPPEAARIFAEAALLSDPIKAVWKQLHQFNNCDPARIHVPTLVVSGELFDT
jgi:pimeloyl-ACP methyl ester carboxylesterase